jgi:hypothetical protein
MGYLTAAWCIFGWGILAVFVFGTPLICAAVIWKWTSLMSKLAQRPAYANWKKLLGNTTLLLLPIIITCIVFLIKQALLFENADPLLGVAQISFHPAWIVICIAGFVITRNFGNESAKNLRIERVLMIAGYIAYLFVSAWYILLPVPLTQLPRIPLIALVPFNFLLGFTYLRTAFEPPPDKRRPLKFIIRDVIILYVIVLMALLFPQDTFD